MIIKVKQACALIRILLVHAHFFLIIGHFMSHYFPRDITTVWNLWSYISCVLHIMLSNGACRLAAISVTHLKIRHPYISSGAQWIEFQWLDSRIGHQDSSPSNVCQGDICPINVMCCLFCLFAASLTFDLRHQGESEHRQPPQADCILWHHSGGNLKMWIGIDSSLYLLIEAETKWLTFHRRHVQIIFPEWKYLMFD